MQFTIRHGTRPGFVEIIFDGKPGPDIIGRMKGYHFRFTDFNGPKRWYGKKENLPPEYKDAPITGEEATLDSKPTDAAPSEADTVMFKIEQLRALVERDSNQRSYDDAMKTCDQETADRYKPDGQFYAKSTIKIGRKYCNVDINGSGSLMVDMATKEIFGIKGYGVVHKGKAYGTLDTIHDWHWWCTGGRTPWLKEDWKEMKAPLVAPKEEPMPAKVEAPVNINPPAQAYSLEHLEYRDEQGFGVNVSVKDSPYSTDGMTMLVRAAVDSDFPHLARIMHVKDSKTVEDARLKPVFEKAPLTGVPVEGGVLCFNAIDVTVVPTSSKYVTYFETKDGSRSGVFDAEKVRFIQAATRYDEVHLNDKNVAIFLKKKSVVGILMGMTLTENIPVMKEIEKNSPPLSYAVGCKTNKNETRWSTNAMRYATKEEAEKAGADLFSRWTALAEYCVLPTFDPVYPKPKPVEETKPETLVQAAKEMGKLEIIAVKDKTPEEIARGEFEKNMKKLKGWMSEQQRRCVLDGARGEEKEFFYELANRLNATIAAMPKTYDTEGQGGDRVIHLHYFKGGADWWILEKDKGSPDDTPEQFQSQAYGQACLGQGYGDGELGYISIAELIQHNVELDFHWKPITLKELLAKRNPEEPPAPEPEPTPDPEPLPTFPESNTELSKEALESIERGIEQSKAGEYKPFVPRIVEKPNDPLPRYVHGEADEGDDARLEWISKMRDQAKDLRAAEIGMVLVK